MTLNQNSKIYIAGHRGLVGSAIWKNLLSKGYHHLIGRTHKELDLTDQLAVRHFFDEEKPDAVVLAAAHVGGIMANSIYRADFIMENMMIQCNVIRESFRHDVKKLLFLGSTCIYPREAPQPMKEDCLLTSPLEYTNEEYAIAKIAGLKMCESYNLQYGTNYIAVMPTNLYGPNDNFDLENSHVLPAMIRKIHLARLLHEGDWEGIRKDISIRPIRGINNHSNEIEIEEILKKYGIYSDHLALWGTGSPMREFLWSEDMADASVYILLNVDFKDIIGIEKYSSVHLGNNSSHEKGGALPQLGEIRNCHINIGTGKEISIKGLSEIVAKTIGYRGNVFFDASKPDGTLRKLTDVSKLQSLGWHHRIELERGIDLLYRWYLKYQH
jgi:GDP-L-fucose synthase